MLTVCLYYIYHVNKLEARLLFLYLPLKKITYSSTLRMFPQIIDVAVDLFQDIDTS